MKMTAEQLQNRLIDFSTEIISISKTITKDKTGEYLCNQIIRSGLAPSLMYAEACSAESKADFIHKLKLCLKELRETKVCLILIMKNTPIESIKVSSLINESDELISIFVKSTYTANNKISTRKK